MKAFINSKEIDFIDVDQILDKFLSVISKN